MYARYPDTRKHTEPGIGCPDNAIVGGVVEGDVERVEGRRVEEERPDELDDARPPVDSTRLECDDAETSGGPTTRRTISIEGLQALQPGGGREEDRADKEHRRVRARSDELREPREWPHHEAGRTDRKQDADPPRGTSRRPPDPLTVGGSREARGVLAVRARRPLRDRALCVAKRHMGRELDRVTDVRPASSRTASRGTRRLRRRPRCEGKELVLPFANHPVVRLGNLVPRAGEVAERLGDDKSRLVRQLVQDRDLRMLLAQRVDARRVEE